MSTEKPLLFALSESAWLGQEVGGEAGIGPAALEERSFEQGEFKLRPLVSVRDRTVFVVQSLADSPGASIAQRLVRLLFLLCTLRDGGAAHTIACVPYLAYARKERRTQPRDPVHTRYLAQLLESTGLSRLIALDVHSPAALDNAYRIGVDHLSALPMFAAHLGTRLRAERIAVASPDVGGIKRAQLFRELLQRETGRPIELAFLEKRRAGGEVSGGALVGEVGGCSVIVIDDLCASGGTLLRAAEGLRQAGATEVHAVVTHAPLPAGLAALLEAASLSSVTVTDSVGPGVHEHSSSDASKLIVLPVAPLLGEALKRLAGGRALIDLLQRWPPARA